MDEMPLADSHPTPTCRMTCSRMCGRISFELQNMCCRGGLNSKCCTTLKRQ